ncbi:helix-turn-helix transcriptional regulator [Actinacidiphila sp. bgisy160]|uniref:helix-turn-helix transcriptional regulator n=1 Tax=Actinacidiphila sp. bgisy160 TaxID=3413796 RepID=UPI003D722451
MLGNVQNQSVSPVFVGRARELTRLTSALARAHAGEPQALVIGGEAGVGKTRLVEEFLAAAEDGPGTVTAVGACVEIGADGLPFAPVATILRALHRRLGDELVAAAAGREGELARLLPGLSGTDGPDLLADQRDEHGRARLFELTSRLLERLSEERTLVVALEDLHWADRSTRELLGYLLRSLSRGRLVVLATYRSDDIHRRHPLRPFLAELDRMRSVARLELSRFNRAEVRAQVAGILDAEPSSSLVDRVFGRSDGNPFFVEELACSITQGCRAGLSDSLRDLLLVRVETLPETAQRVARVVAEGGSAVEYRLLEAVAGLGEDELIEALRSAVGAKILQPTDDGDGYRFRHSLVREAVGDDLLPGERSRINRRYAQVLEAAPGLVPADELPARLASYWYHAHEPGKALPAVLSASVEARRRHAYAEQHRLLERALELWDGTPEEVREKLRAADYVEVFPPLAPGVGDPGGCDPGSMPLQYMDLLAETTVAARLSADREGAYEVTKRALRLLERSGDPLRAAWFWIQRSRLMVAMGRGDGWAEIAEAQELVRGLPPSPVHAEVLESAAGWDMMHDPGPDSIATAERAIELARLVGAEETELHARVTLGILLADAGDADAGIAELEAARERAAAARYGNLTVNTDANLAALLEAVGRSEEAIEVARRGVESATRHGLRDGATFAAANEAESLLALGRWDEAAEVAARGREGTDHALYLGWAATLLAHLAVLRGEYDRAEAEVAAARDHLGPQDHQPQNTLPLRHLTIAVAAGRGRFLEARAAVRAALEAGFPPAFHRYVWPMLHTAAAVEADALGLPGAEAGRPEMLALIRKAAGRLPRRSPVWAAHALLVEAELLRAEGSTDPGRWAAAEEAYAGLDRPYSLALVRLRHAEALLARHDAGARDHAAGLLRRACEVADSLGAVPLRDAVRLLARRGRLALEEADAAPEAAGEPEPFGLTAREREVLRRVAAGYTNRRIAEELFISPKTASVHVSNILAKLGVSGRGEAAALAHRLRLFAGQPG